MKFPGVKACHLLVTIMLVGHVGSCQNAIQWFKGVKLQFSDFQSPTTKIGETDFYTLHPSCGVEFGYQMSSVEFMATKNFNSKVVNSFKRDASSIIAPDDATALELVDFAQYYFDLCELYARRFRKRIYEEKGAFSNASFFQPMFDESQRELAQRYDLAGKETRLGKDKEKLIALHSEVMKEIEELAEFCRECKPVKKKKQKG